MRTDDLAALLKESAFDPRHRAELMACVQHCFGGSNVTFALLERSTQQPLEFAALNAQDVQESFQRYQEDIPSDPWFDVAAQRRVCGAVIGSDLVAPRVYRRTAFYNDIMRPAGIEHMLATGSVGRGEWDAFLVINRSRDARPFTSRERDGLQGLHDAFLHSARCLLAMRKVPAGLACVRIGPRGVEHVDRAAWRLLDGVGAVRVGTTGIEVGHPALDRRIQDFVAGVLRGDSLAAEVVSVPVGSGAALELLELILIPDAEVTPELARRPFVHVALRKRTHPHTEFGHRHGLTPRERAILSALLEGLSIKEIATQSVRAEATVRMQVKSLLHKTGARSQADLIRRVLQGR